MKSAGKKKHTSYSIYFRVGSARICDAACDHERMESYSGVIKKGKKKREKSYKRNEKYFVSSSLCYADTRD